MKGLVIVEEINELNVVNDTREPVVEAHAADGSGAERVSVQEAEVTQRRRSEQVKEGQSAQDNSKFRRLRLENEAHLKEIEQLRSRLESVQGPQLETLKEENERYREQILKSKLEADLREIRKLDPTVEQLHLLGEDFLRLVENGIDAKTAYLAVKTANSDDLSKPPVIGELDLPRGTGSEFFTSKELDKLTISDLSDPEVFNKAMRSMSRL